ncbi:hypothetical protein [uncultured Clostridium sp.]|uniref:hypothetical protein n=1 Tax=uncultured Clostridium sp. TaxID=59620 RepID=UPI0025872AF3|nr:hypothetical protein [uncultured Clostridium sp.]
MKRNVNKELKNLNKAMEIWLASNENLLFMYGRPFQSNTIFIDIIRKVIKNDGKVLYLWGNEGVSSEIVKGLSLEKGKKISYSKDGLSNSNLVFMSFKYTYNIIKNYDLVIIDDISTYFKMNSFGLESLYNKCRIHSKKIIVYGIESCSFVNRIIDISNFKITNRFLEPRTITTRIDLNKDIPYSLYDYILWFKERKSKIAFFVPYYEDIENLYNYYVKEIKIEGVKVIKAENYKNDLNIKDRAIFIITNNMEDVCKISQLDGIVTLFADNDKIDYKKILYMCGKLTTNNDNISEVILVCKEVTKEIEKASKLTREFNKKLWEEHYLSL